MGFVGVIDFKGETIVSGNYCTVPKRNSFDYEANVFRRCFWRITPARIDDETRSLQSVEEIGKRAIILEMSGFLELNISWWMKLRQC